jgi:glyoxylase-like metal-dependent hydrolase (beta-lactamase superfamily II)
MQTANLLAWFIALFVLPAAAQTAPSNSPPKPTSAEGPLRVHTENPRYFTDGSGKAIYLGGHQVFTEIQDNAWTKPWVLDWPKHLEFMKERNLNYLRNWIIFSTGGDPKNPASPMPYARTGPGTALDGGPKFDLRKFDETYFQRLHDGIPIYRVGRVGPEHAYVGDIWLIKTPQVGILVDSAGTSAVSSTLERIKAAGVDPRQIHYLLLSHTHGDHVGGAYLWRSMGAKVVAPASAAFPATWMVPTLNHYGIWVPCAIDQPLPLARPGDTTQFTLDGLDIQAIFAPGHSFDTVVYVLNLAGRRVLLTGDIGFQGNNHILNRCWGDLPKARTVMEILRERVLPLKPEIVFTGHDQHSNGIEYWQDILRVTEEAIRKAEAHRNQ